MTYLTTQAVHDKIKQAITDRSPFSLIRLGDGEARLIGYPAHVAYRDLNTSLNYWYGSMKPDRDGIGRLRAELITACQGADVLGLPNAEQQSRNTFYKLLHYLAMAEGMARNDTCHCGVHRWLYSEGLLYDLLQGLPSVTLITCRDVCDIFENDLLIDTVRWIPVPQEAQTGQPTERHYPVAHSRVLRELDVGPGDVVLVGAGPNGKVYCDAAKRDGAIALDIGSIFDLIAGVPSRSYIKMELAGR